VKVLSPVKGGKELSSHKTDIINYQFSVINYFEWMNPLFTKKINVAETRAVKERVCP
jgi:hypothetical protein